MKSTVKVLRHIGRKLSDASQQYRDTVDLVVQYRTFHNSDPPEILKLWHVSSLGPSAAEGFPCDILELFVFSQPFFDTNGFIVAVDGDRICGFIHAGFRPNEAGNGLDRTSGVICGLVVHPEHRRAGIGRELLKRAESYLSEQGASSVVAGGGPDGNGFYNGIYGGLQCSGFAAASAPWTEFFSQSGYEPHLTTKILHRDLSTGRDPVSSRIIRYRRRLNLVITDRVGELNWWWHVRFGQLDGLTFELRQRHDEMLVASGQIVGLDVYVPKWGVRAVGLQDVHVPEEHRRHGYGMSLVLEICRRLREQSIQLVEVQVEEQNVPAFELFTAVGFEPVAELVCFRREL